MDLVKAIADLDQSPQLHEARLIILINVFTSEGSGAAIEGLTKLAKLDFLLRYPVMLERALQAKGVSTKSIKILEHERYSVESEMVRYRFGPWDHRYREFLNILVAKGLASVNIEGRKVVISGTTLGRSCAAQFADSPGFEIYERRAALLKKHFDITATHLMQFIYETFPEIVSLRSNSPISL